MCMCTEQICFNVLKRNQTWRSCRCRSKWQTIKEADTSAGLEEFMNWVLFSSLFLFLVHVLMSISDSGDAPSELTLFSILVIYLWGVKDRCCASIRLVGALVLLHQKKKRKLTVWPLIHGPWVSVWLHVDFTVTSGFCFIKMLFVCLLLRSSFPTEPCSR